MSDRTKKLGSLSPDQLDLAFKRLQQKQGGRASTRIPRRDPDLAALPLSFSQQRLWLLDQLEPGGAAYNIPSAVRLSGRLDSGALFAGIREIVRRHEALRTTFLDVAGEPLQAIARDLELPFLVVDLAGLDPESAWEAARALARAEARRPFRLQTGPLLRVTLLRLAPELHILLTTLHHIIADGWSTGVLIRELATVYEAFSAGRPSPLAELRIQYADFALWQRSRLSGELLASEIGFWRERLRGLPPVLELPADRPRPAISGDRGDSRPVDLGIEVSAAIRSLAQRLGATPFMVLLALFQACLGRHAGQTDVAVGTPVAGRNRAELEELIGFFVNMLVLRSDLSGDPSLAALLGRIKPSSLEDFTHQELPFEKLVEELAPGRHMGHTPLFQVAFSLQNTPAGPLALPDLEILPLDLAVDTAKFDLTLSLLEREGRFAGRLSYRGDLFDGATAERLVEHFGRLAGGAVRYPDQPLSELPLLSPGESQALLVEWNATAAAHPQELCLHELIEAQVDRTPNAVAVLSETESLTYRELDRRASCLARHLRSMGVGSEVKVGVAAERSLDMVVGLFAVLKAGGAYVPIDPAYPRERLAYMLGDARVPVLLTQRRLAGALPVSGSRQVFLDDVFPDIFLDDKEALAAERIAAAALPDNLAYVIYTSGSTGRPKGAMNTHRAIVNRLLWMQKAYGLDASDRVLQKTPFSFDVSVWELFWPLLVGARLVVARPGGHQDPAYLSRLIGEQGVTTLHFVPSMLAAFLEEPDLSSCRTLRRVITSGEALSTDQQERFFARLGAGGIGLHNLYGPTEAAVDVTFWACEPVTGRRSVPIGRPIDNLRIHLLDRGLRPVPIGVPGHLHIGGVGLARGYHDRPALTAERFVPDPVGGEPGARLYATGDLARHLPSGAIEFLGRIDHQVKLRGFRIELGEIEAVLCEHPAVAEAVVVGCKAGASDLRLAAYIVPDSERALPVRNLLRLEREGRLAGLSRSELPNGFTILHRSRAETGFVYREIFEEKTYLKHGVTLADGDVVFDVGANIGLFSLFAGSAARGVTVFAFEPVPEVFAALAANAELHGLDVHAFPCGLAEEARRQRFTYYAHNSIVSGRYADAAAEREVVRSYERGRGSGETGVDRSLLDELLAERMAGQEIEVELKTLSEVVRQNGIERIDLLKIDVEKSERDVLLGIAPEDWPKIRQIVAEVHDIDGRVRWVVELLRAWGFEVAVEQEAELGETSLHAVYAVRPEARRELPEMSPRPIWGSPERLRTELRSALGAKLPEYMVPSVFVLLEALPLSPNGKVDRQALPAPDWTPEGMYVAPRTPAEELLAGIWCELLGRERVGVKDDFFALGGHSLLGTRLIARVRAAFGVELPLRRLFERPTVEALCREIEQARTGAVGAPPAIERLPREGEVLEVPLSFSQERLWFLDRLEPGTPAFNIPAAVDLRGDLDTGALGRALSEVVLRHESLRTAFPAVGGAPVQRIAQPAGLSRPAALPVIDLGALPERMAGGEAARLAAAEALRGFDLARGPLFAAALLRFARDHHRFLFVVHHIVSDGWSMRVLVRELATLYAAFSRQRPSPLAELPVQYADFTVWQRRVLESRREAELAYWAERLGGEPALLDLPADRLRPAVQTYRGGSRLLVLPPALAARLQELGRAEGATLFMTLLAAAQSLLGRHSGQEDILVGTPVAGRRTVETESLIGIFLNTLVLRTDLSGEPSFRQLLARVKEVTLGAFSHQDLPFEALLARLGGERDLSRTPLFQVFFNMLNLPDSELRLPGLAFESLPSADPPAKFDMTFYVAEAGRGIHLRLVYNADLFAEARIADLLDQLALLTEQAVKSPDAPLRGLSLVTAHAAAVLPDPRAALDSLWHSAVHDLFRERARELPERRAIADREGEWTYGELDQASDGVARWLFAHGVRKGDRVAVLAHRSAPLAQAVLGALKAGAAFTMLDPVYPAARLVEILEIAEPRAFVALAAAGAAPAAVAAWLAASGTPRLTLPGGGPAAALAHLAEYAVDARDTEDAPRVEVSPEDIAVVTFTSGSSGRPKGVLGRHGPLSHFLPWQCERFGITAEDRVSLLSGLAHDPLQRDLFTPLAIGASIAVPDPAEIGVPGRLAAWMARQGVTVAHLTPAMGQLLTERPAGGSVVPVPGLRLVFLVGDALTVADVARIGHMAPSVTCVNLYGSTETQRAVGFHVAALREGEMRNQQVLPLGRGMRDVQLLVLNRQGRLAGIGEVGEIAVRSPHLALGYLRDEALTAEQFQANPLTGAPEDRIYRTGDLGRYLPDGEVQFAGRADLQIKIRGFRIEPAEIEAALRSLPGVGEAVVLALEERGERRLAACVVPGRPGAVAVAGLREALRQRLPAFMVPASFVLLERLPLNPNGKVDRRALARIADESGAAASPVTAPANELERRIAAVWREVLGGAEVGVQDNFFDLGGHSLLLVRLHARLQELLGRDLPLLDLFRHPTVRAQAEHLGGAMAAPRVVPSRRRAVADGKIALIGMAGRFPGARDLEQFWRNLRDGVEAISFFSEEELVEAGGDRAELRHPRYVRARGVLADAELFDAAFFGCSPLEARTMDPQLRLFLECSWEALEDAGCDPERFPGAIGVYGGVSLPTYLLSNLAGHPELLRQLGGYQMAIHSDRDYLTTQVSYKLGLEGPSLDVQTACSTSLVAVHLARQALLTGDCDAALAGGVSIKVPQVAGYVHEEGGINSADGHCRVFDARTTGTVWGSGLGIVVLKRLEDALADGDNIHAILLGTAVNNDGSRKVGFTAPSLRRQAAVVAAAQAAAGVEPASIGYVEAHGTGTQLGDPIEVAALAQAFGSLPAGSCALGAVKSNIGHLGAAAGVAGLIKTVLALEHREIPPSLHFEQPNPAIDFAATPFYVNVRHAAWPAGRAPRRAGVSSFGLGGTNAHAVLEEAPPVAPSGPGRPWHLLPLSARGAAALEAAAERLARWLERHPEADLADVAYTLQVGRRALPHRRVLVCRDADEARRELAAGDPRNLLQGRQESVRRPVVFLFPGQGAQHAGMGRGLYATEPVFRRELDACADLLAPLLGCDLRPLLHPRPGDAAERAEAERMLRQTRIAQPALFAVEHALARLWLSWGIAPAAMLGHSLGEYVAACLAGVFSLEDALTLVAARGELMQRLPAGAMLSVELPEGDLLSWLEGAGPGVDLAAVNGPSLCVVAGPPEEVAGFESRLTVSGVTCRSLHTSHAFHSAMMDPVLGPFAECVARVELRPPAVPYVSSLTGDWVTAAEATDPAYWAEHLRRTVRFGDAAARMLADSSLADGATLLEVGPGRALGSLARRAAGPGREVAAIASMRHPREENEDDLAVLLRAAGRLWLSGLDIEWEGLRSGDRRRRLALPTYPFQRQRHWVEPAHRVASPRLDLASGAGEPDDAAGSEPSLSRPRSGLEARIAVVFEDLLGVDGVGPHDGFFELGGHSLLGTRLVSRLRDELGVELRLEALFASSTPAGLALEVQALMGQEAGPAALPPIVPVPRTGPDLPLSFAQERLWFLDRLQPGNVAYNIPAALRLRGFLDIPALARTLGEIVGRHEVLRTTFVDIAGRGWQRIAPEGPAALPLLDLSRLPEVGRGAEALRLSRAEARAAFDLAVGPLFRASLLRLAADDHLLLVTMHHIVSDGWSLGVLVRELTALYTAFAAVRPSPLAPLALQYADYAQWQRQWLEGAPLAAHLEYWREHLAGAPPLVLPADRPRPPAPSRRGGRCHLWIDAETTAALGELARECKASLFIVLLAAFEALLYRSTRQADLVVGTSIANRSRSEIEGLIGFFVNALAIRAGVPEGGSFLDLLERVRQAAVGAYAHQDLPFERLVQELAPERHGGNPFLQVSLVLQNAPLPALRLPGLLVEAVEAVTATAKLDLTLLATEADGRLLVSAEYSSDLFERTTVSRILEHFRSLASHALSQPGLRLDDLLFLSAAEVHQACHEWNDTRAEPEEGWVSFPRLFAAQAERTPDAVALTFLETSLTYAELRRRAAGLARHLRRLGCGPESRAAVVVERSADLMIGLLGALEAGVAYVPLDPRGPRQRMESMLAEIAPDVLLTQERLLPELPAHAARTLCLDGEWDGPGEAIREPAADQLAYVLYTSGSTGQPKGVMVTHRGLVSYLTWAARVYPVREGRGAPVHSPVTFDLTVTSLFLPLLVGGTVFMLPEGADLEGGLAELVVEGGLGLVKVTPAHLEGLSHLLPQGIAGDAVRSLVVGGEALLGETVRPWLSSPPGRPTVRVFNEYGPTETVVGCCVHEVLASALPPGPVPIGRPISNLRIHLLDLALWPVGIGAPGEIFIGGAGVGRGYLGRPDLTAERFVPDPFSEAPGDCLYRTGDLARHLPDGSIEFLGRIDDQVKIRGFRIELAEVEAALGSCPGVRECAAVVADGRGGRHLAAYVVTDGAGEPERSLRSRLRAFARERLPAYAVPTLFERLGFLPLTPHGKVDRKALAARGREWRGAEGYAAPRTPVEELLIDLWGELLGMSGVGIHDDFFELGGHSLLATQVVTRIRGLLGFELPVRELFERPTVARLAAWIEGARGLLPRADLPPIARVPRGPEMPLSFAQQRLWFLHQLDPRSPAYNMPFALSLEGALDPAALAWGLAEVVDRHEVLRTALASQEGRPVPVVSPSAPLALPLVDLSALPAKSRETAARRLAALEALRPFDLARAPLARATLLRLEADRHVFLLTLHHVASDGWSMDLLIAEVLELYDARRGGREPRLPELPVQYTDFASWQRLWLRGEVLAAQVDRWRDRLAGAPGLLELPTDRPRPPVQGSRGGRARLEVEAGRAEAWRTLGRNEGCTPFMTLLAAWSVLLHRYSGQGTVVVGTPIANRDREEIESLIGLFANTLALRTDLEDAPDFRRLLGRVHETALAAYTDRDLPFEKLVEELRPQRDPSHAPIFQVLLVHQGMPSRSAPRPEGLEIQPLTGEQGIARFDLTLVSAERRDGLTLLLDYDADLFERVTMERHLRLFVHLLDAAAEGPDTAVSDLPLLDEEERRQVVSGWNGTELRFADGELGLHELFERWARRTPGAVAVRAGGEVWTFGQLDGWAVGLARRLRRLGVGPEVRVGVCLERSAAALAALLGVLKAGGAYVPLDPEWPRERLSAILGDSGVWLVLTSHRLAGNLAGMAVEPVLVEPPESLPEDGEAVSPPAPVLPDSAAYVIYTSGSTGVPKGVMATHRGAVNFVLGLSGLLAVGPGDGLLLFAPLSFDASVLQIFLALANGAGLAVHPDPRQLASQEILAFCERHEVTVLDLPAALWRQWVEDVAGRRLDLPPGLRAFLTGGESIPVAKLRTWGRTAGRPATFLSSYGPTEATVTATVFKTGTGEMEDFAAADVPIGRPLPNVRAYVLDRRLEPVPCGVPGELFLAGAGLTRGYLGRPELSAAVFLPDAMGGEPGGRLYRTGDLARFLPAGDLEFLGRADRQVKLRGFRLELDEVESTLARHPAVRDAAVLLREDSPGDRRLAAYVVFRDGSTPSIAELRAFVEERLPRYMMPSAFLALPALPVLASGKVDRAALPALDSVRPEGDGGYVPPRTAEEELLAGIWAQVLRLDRVGVRDNFFELGGDSILSIQVVARAHQSGLALSARHLFEHQTVAELARVATAGASARGEQGAVSGPVPLTPIQRWFFERETADPHHFNQAVMLEVREPLDPAALARAAAALLGHHDALRLRFRQQEGEWRQDNAAGEPATPFTVVDLGCLTAARRSAAVEAAVAQIQAGFDLARGPLTRLALFAPAAAEAAGRLLWTAHHLVVDGVSWRVLLEDLETAYGQAARRDPILLPPKTTSFRAWSGRLAEQARQGALEGERQYWLDLAGWSVEPIPVDFPAGRLANTNGLARKVSMALDVEETRILLQELPAALKVQINDVLLAALARAFWTWTGSAALLVALEGHGREPLFDDVDLSRTVGWFTIELPVLLEAGDAATPRQTLTAVKEQLRRIPGRGIGYGLLRYAAGDEPLARALREAPQPEVAFNYLGQLDQVAVAAGPFQPTLAGIGPERGPRALRPHLLEVTGLVAGDRFQLSVTYGAGVHRRSTIERLVEHLGAELRDLLACRSGASALSAADFPLAQLDEQRLRKLVAVLDPE